MNDNVMDDYYIKSCNIEVSVNLKQKRAVYSEKNILVKKAKGEIEYIVAFEIGAKCLNLNVYTDANGTECPQVSYKYTGTDYYKNSKTVIPSSIGIDKEIIIQVDFERDIRVEIVEGFFDQHNYVVGLFHYNERYCEHYTEHIVFKNNNDYPIKIKKAISPAKENTTNYEKEIEFRRDKIPEKRYTPLTIVVEQGDLKQAQNNFQKKWTFGGAFIGFVLSLSLYIIDKINFAGAMEFVRAIAKAYGGK